MCSPTDQGREVQPRLTNVKRSSSGDLGDASPRDEGLVQRAAVSSIDITWAMNFYSTSLREIEDNIRAHRIFVSLLSSAEDRAQYMPQLSALENQARGGRNILMILSKARNEAVVR